MKLLTSGRVSETEMRLHPYSIHIETPYGFLQILRADLATPGKNLFREMKHKYLIGFPLFNFVTYELAEHENSSLVGGAPPLKSAGRT